MSNANAFESLLNDMAKKAADKRKPKPQPLNGGYRNQRWYRHIFNGKSAEEAYDLVVINLKNPSYKFEPEAALDVYQEVYGVPFQSREERAKDTLEKQNEELRKKIAELEAAKPKVTDDSNQTIEFEDFPTGMDKEAFKVFYTDWFTVSQGHAPDGPTWGRAWKRYNKANEIEA